MFDRLISLLVIVGLVWNGFPTTMPHAGILEAARGGDSVGASQVAEHAGHENHGQPVAPADENAMDAPCHNDGAREPLAGADPGSNCCDGGTCSCGCLLHSALPALVGLQMALTLPALPASPRMLGAAPNHDDPLLRPPA